jgi:hypothetical protein
MVNHDRPSAGGSANDLVRYGRATGTTKMTNA